MNDDTPNMESGEAIPPARPMTRDELRLALHEIPVGMRIDGAISTFVLACVSLGFARTAVPPLRQRSVEIGAHPLSGALKHLAISIAQKAVLDAAATFDQAGEGTSSLARVLNLITRHLENSTSGSDAEREAARQQVNDIRNSVITKKSHEIASVRYWRNKWAAHRSLDPQVDPWAWENPVDFAIIESGLEQMRSAFYEFAVLLTQLPELARLHKDARRINDSAVRMGIDPEGAASWPVWSTMSIGEKQAEEFLNRTLPVLKP